jgi:hypothetical protein
LNSDKTVVEKCGSDDIGTGEIQKGYCPFLRQLVDFEFVEGEEKPKNYRNCLAVGRCYLTEGSISKGILLSTGEGNALVISRCKRLGIK